MKNPKHITLFIALLFSSILYGQNSKMNLGVKLGYGYNFSKMAPNHIESESFEGFPSYSDYAIGLQSDYRLSTKHVLRSSITLIQFGYYTESYIDPYFGYIRNSYETKGFAINAQLEYQYHFIVKEKWSSFINSGMNLGIPIAGSFKTIHQDGSIEEIALENMNAFNTPNYSILIGLGTNFKTKSRFNGGLNPNLQYQLNERYANWSASKPYSIGLMLSINYSL